MSDYETIETVIRFINEHRRSQPSLQQLADIADLSPHHFQRVFQRWAGVSPKVFLQYLTALAAKSRLKAGENVLQAAISEGLSGPSRLHDLTIKLESATPGEIKSGGAGWTIFAGLAPSPFGQCLIANGPRGICKLAFVDTGDESAAQSALQDDWPNAEINWDTQHIEPLAERVFRHTQTVGGASAASPIHCLVRGSEFQLRVWRALIELPPGTVASYGMIAKQLKTPGASRAVGTAVGSNDIAYLIPCHRVIRETGVIGQFRWGSHRKQAMLAHEFAQCDPIR